MNKNIIIFGLVLILLSSFVSAYVVDDFEDGDYTSSPVWSEDETSGGSASVQSSISYEGSYALDISTNSNGDNGLYRLKTSISHLDVDENISVYVRKSSTTTDVLRVWLADYDDFTPRLNLGLRSDGTIKYNGDNIALTQISASYSANTWYEFKINRNSNSFDFYVYDSSGSLLNSALGVDVASSYNSGDFDGIYLEGQDADASTAENYFDNVAVENGSVAPETNDTNETSSETTNVSLKDSFEDADYTNDPTWINSGTSGTSTITTSGYDRTYASKLEPAGSTTNWHMFSYAFNTSSLSEGVVFSTWTKGDMTTDSKTRYGLFSCSGSTNSGGAGCTDFVFFQSSSGDAVFSSSDGTLESCSSVLSDDTWYKVEIVYETSSSFNGTVYNTDGSVVCSKSGLSQDMSILTYVGFAKQGKSGAATQYFDNVTYDINPLPTTNINYTLVNPLNNSETKNPFLKLNVSSNSSSSLNVSFWQKDGVGWIADTANPLNTSQQFQATDVLYENDITYMVHADNSLGWFFRNSTDNFKNSIEFDDDSFTNIAGDYDITKISDNEYILIGRDSAGNGGAEFFWSNNTKMSHTGWVEQGTTGVKTDSGTWDSYKVDDMGVLYDPEEENASERCKMLYTGGDTDSDEAGYAYSSDCKTWTEYSGNPVFTTDWDGGHGVSNMYLVKQGETYYAFFNDENGNGLGYKYSYDMETWYGGTEILDQANNDYHHPGIVFNGTHYNLYAGDQGNDFALMHLYAKSLDSDVKLSTDENVANGTTAEYDWDYIESDEYKWYAKINDGISTVTTPTYNFSYISLPVFKLTAENTYNGISINKFSATISNSTFSETTYTDNGTIYADFGLLKNITVFNITGSEGVYFNRSYNNYNTSSNLNSEHWQAEVYTYAQEKLTNNTIENFNLTIGTQFNNSNNNFTTHYVNAENLSYTAKAENYDLNNSGYVSLSNLEVLNQTLSFIKNRFNVTGKDFFTNETVTTFNVSINGKTYSTTNGTIYNIPAVQGVEELTYRSEGYLNKTIEHNTTQNLTIYFRGLMNHFYFINAITGDPLTKNLTVTYPDGYEVVLEPNSTGGINFSAKRGNNVYLGEYTLVYPEETGLVTPATFTPNINETSLPVRETYEIGTVKLTVNVFDRESGNLLTGVPVDLIMIGYFNITVLDGTETFNNLTLESGEQIVQAITDGYSTEQKTFDFSTQEEIEINLYPLNLTGDNTGSLFVSVIDPLYKSVPGATINLQEYNFIENSYVTVSECISNSNGECQFFVELNTKTYKLFGSKIIDGVLYTDSTNPEILRTDNEVRELFLKTTTAFQTSKITDLTYSIEDNVQDILDGITNTTSINVTFSSESTSTVCVAYYNTSADFEFISKDCASTSAGSIENTKTINRDYNTLVQVYQIFNDYKVVLFEKKTPKIDSFGFTLEDNELLSPFILLPHILLLGLAFLSKNVLWFFGFEPVIIWWEVFYFPSIAFSSVAVLITFVCIVSFKTSLKKRTERL